MRDSTLCRWATILVVVTTGCDEGPTEPYSEPTDFFILSGDQQTGKAGERLTFPLLVAATDAEGGPGQYVTVDWRVTSGAGYFGTHTLTHRLISVQRTSTGTDGTSGTVFVPTTMGPSSVTASATTSEGTALGSVTFTATADTLVINIGALDWDASWPKGPRDVPVPVGTPVQWSVVTMSDLPGQLISAEIPPGGTSFSSPWLSYGDRFTFTPDAAGTWEWEWDNDDWGWFDNVGTLTVQ